MRSNLLHGEVTDSIISTFYAVHNHLGYGFLESVYVHALVRELRGKGHEVARESTVRIYYKGEPLCSQRIDMIVDGLVIVECKTGPALPPIALPQAFNYLRATALEVALVLHFGPAPAIRRVTCPNANKKVSIPLVPPLQI